MKARRTLLLSMVLVTGCGGSSSSTGADATSDGSVVEASFDAADAAIPDSSAVPVDSEVAPEDSAPLDAPAETSVTGCPTADVLVPPTKLLSGTTKLLPFAGYLWASTYEGLIRVSLPSGTAVRVPGFGGYPDAHLHGSKLVVASGFQVSELDPVTLTKTSLFSISGSYTNYIPGSALEGENLFVLRDTPSAGTELGRISLADGVWNTIWTGTKASGIERGKGRSFLDGAYGSFSFLLVVDPGSGAPGFDNEGRSLDILAVDDNAVYFRWWKPAYEDFDIYRLAHDASTPTRMNAPSKGKTFEVLGSDGARLIHAGVHGDYGSEYLVPSLHDKGTWTKLPCIDTGTSWADAAAIFGSYAYIVVRATPGYMVRVKLP